MTRLILTAYLLASLEYATSPLLGRGMYRNTQPTPTLPTSLPVDLAQAFAEFDGRQSEADVAQSIREALNEPKTIPTCGICGRQRVLYGGVCGPCGDEENNDG